VPFAKMQDILLLLYNLRDVLEQKMEESELNGEKYRQSFKGAHEFSPGVRKEELMD